MTRWSKAQADLLTRRRAQHWTYKQIKQNDNEALGNRSINAIKRKATNNGKGKYRPPRPDHKSTHSNTHVTHIDVPQDVLQDRERRKYHEPTPNQLILGDPLPGCSALDRRRS